MEQLRDNLRRIFSSLLSTGAIFTNSVGRCSTVGLNKNSRQYDIGPICWPIIRNFDFDT